VRAVPLRDEHGKNLRWYGILTDIEDRKRTEEELKRTEAWLRETQALAHAGSFVWDVRTRGALYISDEWYRIFGFDPEEGGNAWERRFQRAYPEDRVKWQAAIEQAIRDKADYALEVRLLLPDGTAKHVNIFGHPVLNAAGEAVQFMGCMTDITERKRSEESLRESEERFRVAFENAVIGMALVDMEGHPIKCNPALEKMLGYSDAELAQMSFTDFTFPEDRELDWALYSELVRGERSKYEINKRYITKDGHVIWARLIVSLVRDTDGRPKYALGMAEDFTERKRAEEERERLRQLEADLAHINRVSMMGEMAASLAHEVKQPIAAAITSASTCVRWLDQNPPALARARAAAIRVERDGTRAARIIDRLRFLYKKAPPERELVDVNEIIREMLVLLRGEANRHAISMRTELDPELPGIVADRVQLQQVFMNLMLNGLEAMRNTGGELTIKSQLSEANRMLIIVSDTGVGLPPEREDRIFDAFFTTKPQGSGMGLAISRSIIESHAGRLWATDNNGRGAAFHFTLPISEALQQPEA
jgi:PAS domain S-box-containing protein